MLSSLATMSQLSQVTILTCPTEASNPDFVNLIRQAKMRWLSISDLQNGWAALRYKWSSTLETVRKLRLCLMVKKVYLQSMWGHLNVAKLVATDGDKSCPLALSQGTRVSIARRRCCLPHTLHCHRGMGKSRVFIERFRSMSIDVKFLTKFLGWSIIGLTNNFMNDWMDRILVGRCQSIFNYTMCLVALLNGGELLYVVNEDEVRVNSRIAARALPGGFVCSLVGIHHCSYRWH